jgi:hypothetical protein
MRRGMLVFLMAFAFAAAPVGRTLASDATALAEDDAEEGWVFSASAYTYLVPHDDDYVQPTVTIDRGWLHLEARYNYEDLDTASLWGGYNLSGGEEITWEVTPMLGFVFGDTDGIAPGYKGSIGWKSLELYSEGEYVIDGHDASDSFFYNWSELTIAPFDWCRFGLVTQRTRAYDTDREVQRGLLAGFSFKRVDATAYVLNPDDNDPVWVFAIGLNF